MVCINSFYGKGITCPEHERIKNADNLEAFALLENSILLVFSSTENISKIIQHCIEDSWDAFIL